MSWEPDIKDLIYHLDNAPKSQGLVSLNANTVRSVFMRALIAEKELEKYKKVFERNDLWLNSNGDLMWTMDSEPFTR